MPHNTNNNNDDKYIYSPMYYSGSKNRILDWLIPLFPEKISSFYDLFCGGLSVSVNVKAESYTASDVSPFVIDLYSAMKTLGYTEFMNRVNSYIKEYHIDDCTDESFMKLRDVYNSQPNKHELPEMLFVLVCHAYNCVLRFNSDGEYNVAPGKDHARLTPQRLDNIRKFVNAIYNTNIKFICGSYETVSCFDTVDSNTFVYCDPPYMISNAEYNGRWNWTNEYALYAFLDRLNVYGVKFGLSNIRRMGNKYNHVLDNWSKKYNIHECKKRSVSMSSRKSRNTITEEIYVCNY